LFNMEGSAMKFVLIFAAILSPILCSGEQPLPLIGWSNTRSLDGTPRISAGKVVSREDLDGKYMDSILQTQPQNILLFVFDELSVDDITRYSDAHNADGDGGAFSNLKTSMYESLSHLVLPMVEPGDLERDLSSKVNGAVVDLKESTLSGLNLDLSKTNLVVKHFSVPSGNNDLKYEAFKEADKVIGALVQRQNAHYTAILTAQHKSKLSPKSLDGEKLTIGRHLLAVEEESKSFIANYNNDSNCNVYMTANQLSVFRHTKDEDSTVVLPNNYTLWSTAGSSCEKLPAIT
jgi:V-type H+-transporting ATPase S1 subunit